MCLLQTHRFLLHKIFIYVMLWCIVGYFNVFISCLDSHSGGTHLLQRIHLWASDVMLNFSKSVLMKKLIHLHLGWSEGEYIFILGWTTIVYPPNWLWKNGWETLLNPKIVDNESHKVSANRIKLSQTAWKGSQITEHRGKSFTEVSLERMVKENFTGLPILPFFPGTPGEP